VDEDENGFPSALSTFVYTVTMNFWCVHDSL